MSALAESSQDWLWEIGRDGRLAFTNHRLETILGYTQDELSGKEFIDLVHPNERSVRVRRFAEHVKNKSGWSNWVIHLLHTDGSSRYLESSAAPIVDERGHLEGFHGIDRDITARVRSQEGLAQSESRFRQLIDHSPYSICEIDLEGRTLSINRAGLSMLDLSDDSAVVGTPYRELVCPCDRERFDDSLRVAVRGHVAELEYCIASERSFQLQLAPIQDASGTTERIMALAVDVTERVLAEAALRNSEETLRSITGSSPDVLMVTDLDGTIRFINRPAPGLEREDVLGTNAYDYIPDDARSQIRDRHRRVIETGRIETFPFDYESPDGNVIASYEVRVGPIYRNGEVAQLAFASTDVTERKRAEEQFRAQYKHFPVPTYTFRQEGGRLVLAGFNDAGFAWSEGRIEPLLGKSVDELYAHEPDIRADFRRCFEERTKVRREFRYRSIINEKDFDVDVTYVFVPPDCVMVHVDDIGERKAALRALERSEKSLANAQRIANLGNWDWDTETSTLSWSDQTHRIFGVDPSSFVPTYEAFLDAVHPEDRHAVETAVERSLHEYQPYAIDHRVLRQDGEVREVHEQGEVTRDADGRPIRMVGTIHDVTEQRLAEQEIRRSLAEKETLLREIHHRVKNNLQVISSLLSLQSQRVDDAAVEALCTEMEQRVMSMAMIHESLYQSTDLSQVDFRRYLEMLSTSLASAYTERGLRIETRVDDISLEIHVAMPCGLIVNELVTNALRHAFTEGSTGTVSVDFSEKDCGFLLVVRDDGVGLPPDLDLARSSNLGLRLVGSLVEQIGAQLDIERNGGTCFRIEFAR